MNFKKLSLIIIMLAMLVLTVKGAVANVPVQPSNGVSAWNMGNLTDVWGSTTLTNTGSTNSSEYPTFNVTGDSSSNSRNCDGTNDIIDSNYLLPTTSSFSVVAWVNPDDCTQISVTPINGRESSTNTRWWFDLTSGNFKLSVGDSSGTTHSSTTSCTQDSWQMIVWTHDESTETNKFFMNTTLIDTFVKNSGSDNTLTFCAQSASAPGGATKYFDGQIDEIMIFNESINNTTIQNIWDTGLRTTNFTITAVNAWNSSSINTFNATINGTTYNTTTGTITTDILNNASSLFNITLLADGYSTRTYTNYNVSSNLAASLYPYNSLEVFAFDIDSGANLSNFSVTLQSVSDYYFNETNSSLIRFDDLVSGEYSARIDSDGYSTGYYVVSVNVSSHQFLYAYLTSSFDNVTFKVVDSSTGGVLEGATVVQKKFINGSLTTIQSKNTDITGRVIMAYQDTIEYTFEIYDDEYVTKTFSLSPSFDEYIIRLTPEVTSNPDIRNDDVLRNLLGYAFTNGTSFIAYEFNSYLGSLESYSVNVSLLNGSSYVVSGSSATGSTLNNSFAVPVVTYGDYADVVVCYKSTFNTYESCFSNAYSFSSWDEQFGNLGNLKIFFNDRSDFEKSFIAVTIILILAGLFSVVGFVVGDGVVMSMVGGIFGVVVSLLIGLLTLASGGFVMFIFFMLIIGWYGKNG